MHIQFLDYLVDPQTKEPLTLEAISRNDDVIVTGFLRSKANEYPIVRGIPRFVEFASENYSKSFGYQWRKWPRVQFESANVGKPMEGHTRRMWERIVGVNDLKLEMNHALVVDVGCGPGRFIDVARSKGARVIGIDYNSSVVDVAGENFRDDMDVCICQADALNLPVKSNSMDGAFSIGVLHHTPGPEKGVHEAYRIIRDEGWFALSVYGRGGYYDRKMVRVWRGIFKVLWPLFKHYPPLMYTYFTNYLFRPLALRVPSLGQAIKAVFPFISLPDLDWSLLDTFDSVTPTFQSAHESYEVFSWLKRAGFISIEPTDWGFTSFHGVK